jgi:hypothetical protein
MGYYHLFRGERVKEILRKEEMKEDKAKEEFFKGILSEWDKPLRLQVYLIRDIKESYKTVNKLKLEVKLWI